VGLVNQHPTNERLGFWVVQELSHPRALEHLRAHDADRNYIPASELCKKIAFFACRGFPDQIFIYCDSFKTVFATDFSLGTFG
jgi:hypothetical protein